MTVTQIHRVYKQVSLLYSPDSSVLIAAEQGLRLVTSGRRDAPLKVESKDSNTCEHRNKRPSFITYTSSTLPERPAINRLANLFMSDPPAKDGNKRRRAGSDDRGGAASLSLVNGICAILDHHVFFDRHVRKWPGCLKLPTRALFLETISSRNLIELKVQCS